VFGYRVAGALIAAACILACGFGAGDALAQYEPVGKPLQLVPQVYSGKPAATPRSRVTAKKAARSESRSESRAETRSASPSEVAETRTQQHVSFRRKHRPRTEVAEQKRPQRAPADTTTSIAAAAPPRARAAPTVPSAPAAIPPTTTAAALPPQAPPPAASSASELVVGGQAVQVRSPNEANELDLAANEPNATASAPATEPAPPRGSALLYNLAASAAPAESDAAPAASAAPAAILATAVEPAPADVAQVKSPIGSAFWIMQIVAALGGAAAAGAAAWYLIGSAPPRIRVSQWVEADDEG
jgi:peptidoglycan DL-endopeptidase CwlO